MQIINAICVLAILGMFGLTIDGKHMEKEANRINIVEKYAEASEPAKYVSGLTDHQATMLATLAKHMGRK